jgi:guanylate kinase
VPKLDRSALLVIVTVEGDRALRTVLSNSHKVFIVPGDTKAAAERVLRRVAPNALPRLRACTDEVKSSYEYDTVIVNQDFDVAVDQSRPR